MSGAITQLQAYVAARGPDLAVRGLAFRAEGVSGDRELASATFRTKRGSYLGVQSVKALVIGIDGLKAGAS